MNTNSKGTFDNMSFNDFFICPNCGRMLNLNDDVFVSYFYSRKINCNSCKEPIDLWKAFKKLFEQPYIMFPSHYSLLGCKQKLTHVVIKPNEVSNLNLSEEIGKGELLQINYTPGPGGTFPIENQGNIPISPLKTKNKSLYGKPMQEDAKETEINVLYCFAPEEIKNDLSNMLLLDAFKFFYEKNYRYMIISAHSAVEIILSKFIKKIFKEYGISKNKTERLTAKIETHIQLDILLPFICNLLNFPTLDKKIVDGLKDLRKDRNNLMHEGETDISDKTKIKTELISAFFAYKYLKFYNEINFL